MSDPYYGLFRLWNLYELNSELTESRQKQGSVKLNDLIVDTDSFSYYVVIGTNPIRYVPWNINKQSSESSLVRLDSNYISFPTPWETYRLLVDSNNECRLSTTLDISIRGISHVKIFRDVDLREVISKDTTEDDSIEYGDRVFLNQKLFNGEVVYYTVWDEASSLVLSMPLIVERTDSVIKTYTEAPIDVRLVSKYISESDPRVIDLRGVNYQRETDFLVRVTYPDGRMELIKLEDDRIDISGLLNVYYGDLDYQKGTLIYRYTDDQTAWLTRDYTILIEDAALPIIQELPEPPRVDLYLTSVNYLLGYEEEDVIEDSALIVGSAIAREVIFSTSSLYPKSSTDTLNQDYDTIATTVSFIAPFVDPGPSNWSFDLLATEVELRELRIYHNQPSDPGPGNWSFDLLATDVVLRELRIYHNQPADLGPGNWTFELMATEVSLELKRIYHNQPADPGPGNWTFELMATEVTLE